MATKVTKVEANQSTIVTKGITNGQIVSLSNLVGKLKTKCLGLDDFEKFVDEKRNLKGLLTRLGEIETELQTKYRIKFTDDSRRFFDVSSTTKEERESFNKDMIALQEKVIETKKFITKKNLLALKSENDLSVDEYELLCEAFVKITTEKAKEADTEPK